MTVSLSGSNADTSTAFGTLNATAAGLSDEFQNQTGSYCSHRLLSPHSLRSMFDVQR
jgi:hypothetical protein